jgi:hypothetical protein
MQHNGPSPNGSTSIELRRRLYAALPGDTVQLAGEERPRAFETVFLCSETIEGQVTEWRWIFLDDGSLLEAAPKGIFRYGRHQAINRGTRRHQELVAQDGALVRFEGHVRAGTWAQRPVHVTVEGVSYRVVYTGTVSAQQLGPEPPLAAWRTFNPDPAKNVFFGLTSTSDEQATILGLWTDDVSLSFGRELRPDELTVTPGAGGA